MNTILKHLISSAAIVAACVASASGHDLTKGGAKVSVVFDQLLANMPGKSMKGVLAEYAPGQSSPAHTHPKSAFICATVLEGAIRSQVNDGPIVTYKAGENFFEMPGDRHGVSANASDTQI